MKGEGVDATFFSFWHLKSLFWNMSAHYDTEFTEHVWIVIFLLYKQKSQKNLKLSGLSCFMTSTLSNILTDCTHFGVYR